MSEAVHAPEDSAKALFHDFAVDSEPKLRQALTSALGPELGVEAVGECLAYGWEHWDRIRTMDNPRGYLYRVGRRWGHRVRARSARQKLFVDSPTFKEIEVEPGLTQALSSLTERQRVVVGLLYGYEWSMSEVAALLGISKPTVQSYRDRAMVKLRRSLGVRDED